MTNPFWSGLDRQTPSTTSEKTGADTPVTTAASNIDLNNGIVSLPQATRALQFFDSAPKNQGAAYHTPAP
jgi:hypothetical protein